MFPLALAFPARRAVEGLKVLERFYGLAATAGVPLADFSRLHSMALESLRQLAVIAREYPLTDEQDEAVSAAIRRVEGFTASMLPDPPPSTTVPPTATGFQWWALALSGAGGALLALLISTLWASDRGSRPERRSYDAA